jgi:DNA-binding NarL/FixJ family response regulator
MSNSNSSDPSPSLKSNPIRLLVAEDHELARNGLLACLDKITDLKVAGCVKNGQECLNFIQRDAVDVILMDIRMPVLDGIGATEEIKNSHPDIKVIMLTSHQEGEEVYASLAAGADAYCLKDIQINRLAEVVRMVNDGAVWLDPAIARMVVEALPLSLSQKSKPQSRTRYNADLTEREREVLEKLVEGKSNREIADDLGITLHTAKAHVCNILQKLAVDDRTTAAVKAVRDGLLQNN